MITPERVSGFGGIPAAPCRVPAPATPMPAVRDSRLDHVEARGRSGWAETGRRVNSHAACGAAKARGSRGVRPRAVRPRSRP